jgi:hypothetical protein
VLVCGGFLQPSKGFDRAVEAFAASSAAEGGARLHLVGSVRDRTPETVAHVEGLRRLAGSTPGVTLHVRFLTDAEFDAWSSRRGRAAIAGPNPRGLARARPGTPAIVAAEGGQPEQAGPAGTVP